MAEDDCAAVDHNERAWPTASRHYPYITARGLRWELHVDETPFSLWTVDGLKPPAPGTAAGERWRKENRPSAWEGS
ncbi:tautomerase family protein [Serratia ureilytica]|uniref:tautomerase family protein n=1 Tax=Serratia ureilytica TaxID=300181 RepID=UPI00313B236A